MKKINLKKILVITLISPVLLFTSCGTTKVTRVDSNTVTDLSGYWNDTDVKIAAEEIIADCVNFNRITQYPVTHNGNLPVVIVGSYKNKSDEHIDTEILTKKLEAALINSGKVDFVASSSEREEIRKERIDQQINASEETAKSLGNELGADFMLQGSIKTIVDMNDNTMTRTYFITTELINIETNRKIWMNDNSSIKKVIKQPKVRF